MDCGEVWQDIFLTKPDYVEMDDEFVAPVMSVEVQRKAGTATIIARTHLEGSNWLALAYPANAPAAEIARWRTLQTGDMIRVGTADNDDFSDYMTVMETVDVDELQNPGSKAWNVCASDTNAAGAAAVAYTHIGVGGIAKILPGQLPSGSLRCVRVNASVDVSTIVNKVTDRSFDVAATPHSVSVDESNRGEVSVYYPLSGTRHYAGSDRREMFFFPCYRQRTWVQHNQPQTTVLQMGMPTNVKKVRAVKLMGYSLSHKRTIGVQHTHEQKEEDWYAIRIKELRTNSAILSNNSHANGALHVLHCGRSPTLSGKPNSAALYQYDADGLSCVAFSPVNLPTITVEVVDRLGGEAHFGRMHVWLRVLITRG
jgi:hypothetical protein